MSSSSNLLTPFEENMGFEDNEEVDEEVNQAFALYNQHQIHSNSPLTQKHSNLSKIDKLIATRTLSLNPDYCFECATDAEIIEIQQQKHRGSGDLSEAIQGTRKRFSSGSNLIGRNNGRATVSTMIGVGGGLLSRQNQLNKDHLANSSNLKGRRSML